MEDLVGSYPENPILTKHQVPYPVETVHKLVFTGGADTVMCVGTAKIVDFVDLRLQKPHPAI